MQQRNPSQEFLHRKREQFQVEIRQQHKQKLLARNREKVESREGGSGCGSVERLEQFLAGQNSREAEQQHQRLFEDNDHSSLFGLIGEAASLLTEHSSLLFSGEVSTERLNSSPLVNSMLLVMLEFSKAEECVWEPVLFDCLQVCMILSYQPCSCHFLLEKSLDHLVSDLFAQPFLSARVFNYMVSLLANFLVESCDVVQTLLYNETLLHVSNQIHLVEPLNKKFMAQLIVNFQSSPQYGHLQQSYQLDTMYSTLSSLMDDPFPEQDFSLQLIIADHVFFLMSRAQNSVLDNLLQYGILSKLPSFLDSGCGRLHDKTLNVIGMVAAQERVNIVVDKYLQDNLLHRLIQVYSKDLQLNWAKAVVSLQRNNDNFDRHALCTSQFNRHLIQLFCNAPNSPFRLLLFTYLLRMLVNAELDLATTHFIQFDLWEPIFQVLSSASRDLFKNFLNFLKTLFQRYLDNFLNYELKMVVSKFQEHQGSFIDSMLNHEDPILNNMAAQIEDDFLVDH